MPRPRSNIPPVALAALQSQVEQLNATVSRLEGELARRDAQIVAAYEGFTKAAQALTVAVNTRCLESDSYSVQARELLRTSIDNDSKAPALIANAVSLAVGALLAPLLEQVPAQTPPLDAAAADLAG